MKKSKAKLALLLLLGVMTVSMIGCGNKTEGDSSETPTNVSTETENDTESDNSSESDNSTETDTTADVDTSTDSVAAGPLVLNYEALPESFVGEWVLVGAYTANDGMLEVAAEACSLEIEENIDTNKLVDEAAYTHADATNLKGTLNFNHADIAVDDYSCSGNWDDWTVVDVKGEGEAYFKGAIKFKVRDDDEGVFFNIITGVEVEDMELFDVLGVNGDGQLILGYSEDNIEKDDSAEWEYAYIFEKK